MKQLPKEPQSPNERVLAQEYKEEQTGVTGTTLTLAHCPLRTVNGLPLEMLYKNGALLASADYSISGQVVTLTTAAISTDVFVARFPYRT